MNKGRHSTLYSSWCPRIGSTWLHDLLSFYWSSKRLNVPLPILYFFFKFYISLHRNRTFLDSVWLRKLEFSWKLYYFRIHSFVLRIYGFGSSFPVIYLGTLSDRVLSYDRDEDDNWHYFCFSTLVIPLFYLRYECILLHVSSNIKYMSHFVILSNRTFCCLGFSYWF